MIERTRCARWSSGRPVYEARPVVRRYDVGAIHGAPAAYYRPQRREPRHFSSYYTRFAVPVALAATAGAVWVAFGSPDTVQQQVGVSVKGDAALKQRLGGVDVQAASTQVQQTVGGAVPVQISEQVRQQVRRQVRLSVAMLQNSKPLVLTDVLASG